jgi:glutamine synthetase type III
MVKLFTDEEMDEKCKDYDPIPMKVQQDVLHRKEPEDRINILNGVIKSPFRIGQPPANVNMYASQIGMMTPVNAETYLREYNRFVDGRMIEQERELEQEIDEVEDELAERLERLRRQQEEELRQRRREQNARYYRNRVVGEVMEEIITQVEDIDRQDQDL